MRRRTFVKTLSLAAAGVSLSGLTAGRKAYGAHLKHFNLGIITDEVHEDVETALEFASQFGLDWVEIRSIWGQPVTDAGENSINRLKKLLQIYGLRVSVVDTVLFKTTLPGTRPILGRTHTGRRTRELYSIPFPRTTCCRARTTGGGASAAACPRSAAGARTRSDPPLGRA